MRYFVCFFLLFGILPAGCMAQRATGGEIVKKALFAHTSGQVLKTYVMRLEYDTLGKIPSELYRRDPFEMLLDSIMTLETDSVKKVMKQQKTTGEAGFLKSIDEIYRGERKVMISDQSRAKEVLITIRPNHLRGTLDTIKNIYSGEDAISFRQNPVDIIRFMGKESTELHYTGEAQANGQTCYVIQFKLGSKWLDAYIEQKSYRLLRLSTEKVDEDPLIGKGPLRYKDIIDYRGYRSVSGFLLPSSIEEFATRFVFANRWNVFWEQFNVPLPEDFFKPLVDDHSRSKFRTMEIRRDVWVLEQLGEIENSRFLVQTIEKKKLTIIGELSNNVSFNASLLNELVKLFPGYEIDGLFNVQSQSGVLSLAGFFAQKAHLYAPKGMGLFAEEKGFMNSAEDSTWHQLRSKGQINTFDREFQIGNVAAIVLNPFIEDNFSQYYTCYYLPEDKVLYYHGNPYSAQSHSKNAGPREKVLYDLIKNRNLAVEKIVFSGAYLNNAPLFMSFDEFERRIQNTDFTIYKKREK
jgi:hypothetical protein